MASLLYEILGAFGIFCTIIIHRFQVSMALSFKADMPRGVIATEKAMGRSPKFRVRNIIQDLGPDKSVMA